MLVDFKGAGLATVGMTIGESCDGYSKISGMLLLNEMLIWNRTTLV